MMRYTGIIGFLVLTLLNAPAAASIKIVTFNSPTNNIVCEATSETVEGKRSTPYVECMTMRNAWPLKPTPPKMCDGDFVPDEIWLGVSRRARGVQAGSCRHDVGPYCFPSNNERCKLLAYGHHLDIGAIRCLSASNGITCRYIKRPRVGFRIAYEGYSLWYR